MCRVKVQDWFRQNFLDIRPILHRPAPILEQSHDEEHPDERVPADAWFREATLSDILTMIICITKHFASGTSYQPIYPSLHSMEETLCLFP